MKRHANGYANKKQCNAYPNSPPLMLPGRRFGFPTSSRFLKINVVFDVDPGEAEKLLQLIELLLEKWYIARNDENELYLSIIESEKDISSQKKQDH